MKLDCILPSSSPKQLCFQWRKGFYFPVQHWILHVLCHLFWCDEALCLTLPDLARNPLILPHGGQFIVQGPHSTQKSSTAERATLVQ